MNTYDFMCVLVLCCISFGLFFVFFPATQIFRNTLYRSGHKPRTRECSDDSSEDQKQMFRLGIKWAELYKDSTDSLHIVNDGLNLYAEYIHLGFDQCAVIVQGRTESLLYSYYYADVYVKNGYNILVIDTRAHGLSDGKFITAGVKEHKDLVLWIELIQKRYHTHSFLVHGVCIGAATAIYAYCATKKEGFIHKLVLDGTYTSYYEMFKNHMIERKKPVLWNIYLTFLYVYLCTGANLIKKTPSKCIGEIDIPVLFIWSAYDYYCKIEKSKLLYDACQSCDKDVRFFANGNHSFVRFHNLEAYDEAITTFLRRFDRV